LAQACNPPRQLTESSAALISISQLLNATRERNIGVRCDTFGARPQTAEIIKAFNQRCPELTVTNILGKADFVVVLDHEGGKGVLRHRNKIAVFNHNGDDIFSDSTRELGNSVKDACAAITKAKK
jgi:hypothetical protein